MRIDKMMLTQIPLSKNERNVLYHLVSCPQLYDKEICKIINMKLSTFSNIKKRLSEMGYYKTVRMPVFSSIGCDILAIFYGLLDRNTTVEQRLKVAKTMLEECREFFYIISESNQGINIAASKNYAEYEKDVQKFNQVYMRYGFLTSQGYIHIIFPFEISFVHNFFNYSGVLNRYLDLGMRETTSRNNLLETSLSSPKIKTSADFTDTEKKVYLGLVEYPDLPDSKLSEKISVSKNTIVKAKKRFFDNGLIVQKVIPNLNLIGFKLLTFTHITFDPNATNAQIYEGVTRLNALLTPVFLVHKNLEGAVLSPYWDFEDFQVRYNGALRFLLRKKLIKDYPLNYILSIPQMTAIKDHLYAPLAKKILEM